MNENTNHSLADKTALITGAASGIGKAIAELYAKNGANVAIADINKNAADATAAQVTAAGGKAIGVAMDVTSEESVNTGTDHVVAAFGHLDILIPNAACRSSTRSNSSRSPTGRRCWRSTWTGASSPPRPRSSTCTRTTAAVW